MTAAAMKAKPKSVKDGFAVYAAPSTIKTKDPMEGLFASRTFIKGEPVGYFEGVPVKEQSPHVLTTTDDDGKELLLSITNQFRYLNHACPANLQVKYNEATGRLDLIAKTRIPKDSEMFIYYGWGYELSLRQS